MILKDRYLVVVSLISGRKFPKKARHHLVAEAKLDGEVLTTDPIPHVDTPRIEQELAWELDKKSLQQHRLQRSSIKVQLYAVDSASPVKELIGYIMLDLRSASSEKIHRWYPVLHSKYSTRPEFYVGLYLDEDGQELVHEGDAAKSGLATSVDPAHLRPVLHQDAKGGYYQIGPEKLCRDPFVLSVTLARAANLSHLIPTDCHLPSAGDAGFFFHFKMLGNSVTSEPFADLVSAEFPAERSSVRVRSTVDMLRVLLEHESPLVLDLCCGDRLLGRCNVPLTPLLKRMDHAFQRPAVLDGVYALEATGRTVQGPIPERDRPCVAAEVVLRRETVPAPAPAAVTVGSRPLQSPPVRERDTEGHGGGQEKKDIRGGETRTMSPSILGMRHQNLSASTENVLAGCDGARHRMCYTIELRSVRALLAADPNANIYARYVYPLFGSAAPIMTHPPVEIRKYQEVLLPQGFCAFEFAASHEELRRRLSNAPLIVEVFNRDRSRGSDALLGTARIDLEAVFLSQKKPGKRQTVCMALTTSGMVDIRSPSVEPSDGEADGEGEKAGELVYSLNLEDFGPLPVDAEATRLMSPTPQRKPRRRSGSREKGESSARASVEYRVALELEAWKETEEVQFRAQLREKEKQHMLSLAEEWRKRDKEREMITKKKIAEYQELEEAVRGTLGDLGRRERQLAAGEAELARLRADVERDQDRRTQDLREASRRLDQECQHKVGLERAQAKHWETLAKEWQSKYQALDKEFSKFKERQANAPESRLQSEIGVLQVERAELERKLDAAIKSKMHYKQMWGRALKELAKVKQREELTAREQLRRQETELEHMRLRYLASEETGLSTRSRTGELEEIKKELEKMRVEASKQEAAAASDGGLHGQIDAGTEEHLARLIEERDSLLRTGVYTMEDDIIAELDREIRRFIAGAGLSAGAAAAGAN